MRKYIKHNRIGIFWLKTVMQVIAVTASWLLTIYFCAGGRPGVAEWRLFGSLLPPLVAIRLLSGYAVTRAQLKWRFASLHNLLHTAGAVSAGSLVFLPFLWGHGQSTASAAALLLLEWFVTLNLLMGLQLAARTWWSRIGLRNLPKQVSRRVLVIGAGDAGQRVVRSMQDDGLANLTPIGFLDDDPVTWGRLIHGIPVYGSIELAEEVCSNQSVNQVLIAIPSLSTEGLRSVIRRCAGVRTNLTMLPRLNQLLGESPTDQFIRKVDPEDLLERTPVHVDLERVAGYAAGQRVLVTGAGGSIGSELCRQIVGLNPECLILLGHGENSLFTIQQQLAEEYGFEASAVVADVQCRDRLENVFREYRPSLVFHAAAHKHVPLMEMHPSEAVRNNVFGTRNVAELSIEYGVKAFVMISTDKAVNPSSVMGASKRVAEMVVQSLAQRIGEARAGGRPSADWGFSKVSPADAATRFAAVRFGNVLGSRGSVIPTMMRQIQKGGPVTVTHPDMVRFFMTIPEAVQLVMQAGAMASGGEVYLLDMGEPVKIVDLAENLIRLSGLVPGRDVDVEITGIRPGEKLYEEMLTQEEGSQATCHERIFMAMASRIDHVALEQSLNSLSEGAAANDSERVRNVLRATVPNCLGAPPTTAEAADSWSRTPKTQSMNGASPSLLPA